MTTDRVGFIGLGNMGGRMTKCIVRADGAVLGYDVNPSRGHRGGSPARRVRRCVTRDSDIVLLSLPDSHVVEAVVLGDDGVLENASRARSWST